MPVQITTSPTATATAYSNQRKVDRCQNGVLWSTFYDASFVAIVAYYSTDNGATWTAAPGIGLSGSSYTANHSFFIDLDDYAHVVYKDPGNGYIYYQRGTPNAARTAWTWSAATLIANAAGSDYPDIIAHREGTGWKAHVVHSLNAATSSVISTEVTITSGGAITTGTPTARWSRVANVNSYPSIDFNHTGDGKTVAGSTPHLYAAWSAGATGAGNGIRFKKATYSGGAWTWGTEREIDSTRYPTNTDSWLTCMFDGTRVIIAGFTSPTGTGFVIDRDAADTTTTGASRTITPATFAHATAIWYGSATYDSAGNVYLFGVNTDEASGFRDLVYRVWNRASEVTGSEVVIDTDVGATPYVTTKRGFSSSKIEFVYTDGTSSPYPVMYDSIRVNQAPTAPTLVTPLDMGSASKTGPVTFDWTFNDPDAGDAQGAYAIRRQRRP